MSSLYIPDLTEIERAFLYPYEAPRGAFLIENGHVCPLPVEADFNQRVPVISVGSNRAPVQLVRKFGRAAKLPVTPAMMQGVDVCHVANIAPYGAIPCSAYPVADTQIRLNIAWLDAQQLAIMHRTEGIGDAYDFVRWTKGSFSHLFDFGARAQADMPVYGYATRAGFFADETGRPYALAALPAEKRSLVARTQTQMMAHAKTRLDAEETSLSDWVSAMQDQPARQRALREGLAGKAVHPDNPPWQVIEPDKADFSDLC